MLFELQKVGFNSIQEQLKDKETGNLKKIEFDTFFNYFEKQETEIPLRPLHEWAKDWTKDNLSENIKIIKSGILNQQKLDAEQSGDLGNEQPDDLNFLGKRRIFKEEEKEESFWDRYGKSIIASTVAGAMAGASGGAIAGGVISALSAPVTGGLSLLGVPFLVGVGAAIGFGIGAISGLLTGIARSLYDNHKNKSKSQELQKGHIIQDNPERENDKNHDLDTENALEISGSKIPDGYENMKLSSTKKLTIEEITNPTNEFQGLSQGSNMLPDSTDETIDATYNDLIKNHQFSSLDVKWRDWIEATGKNNPLLKICDKENIRPEDAISALKLMEPSDYLGKKLNDHGERDYFLLNEKEGELTEIFLTEVNDNRSSFNFE